MYHHEGQFFLSKTAFLVLLGKMLGKFRNISWGGGTEKLLARLWMYTSCCARQKTISTLERFLSYMTGRIHDLGVWKCIEITRA